MPHSRGHVYTSNVTYTDLPSLTAGEWFTVYSQASVCRVTIKKRIQFSKTEAAFCCCAVVHMPRARCAVVKFSTNYSYLLRVAWCIGRSRGRRADYRPIALSCNDNRRVLHIRASVTKQLPIVLHICCVVLNQLQFGIIIGLYRPQDCALRLGILTEVLFSFSLNKSLCAGLIHELWQLSYCPWHNSTICNNVM